jgi:hypothetical protein
LHLFIIVREKSNYIRYKLNGDIEGENVAGDIDGRAGADGTGTAGGQQNALAVNEVTDIGHRIQRQPEKQPPPDDSLNQKMFESVEQRIFEQDLSTLDAMYRILEFFT